MRSRKVGILVLNDLINDSRVIKESTSLSKEYNVEVFCLRYPGKKYSDSEYPFAVNRVCNYSKSSNGVFKRLKQAWTFLKYGLMTLRSLHNKDIVHCNDIETLYIGVLLKSIKKSLFLVYDSHEYQTETLKMNYKYKKRLVKKIEGILISSVDKVIVVSNSIAEAYRNDYSIEKPAIIFNYPSINFEEANIEIRKSLGVEVESKLCIYIGGLGRGRGIEFLLNYFSEYNTSDHLLLLGNGPLEDIIRRSTCVNRNIHFIESVHPSLLNSYANQADIGLLTIENLCKNYNFSVPNKLFEYVRAKLPVLASNLTEISEIIKCYNLGVVFDDFTYESFDLALRKLYENTDVHKQVMVKYGDTFTWEAQEMKFLELYVE